MIEKGMKQFIKRRIPIAARLIRWIYACLNIYRSHPQYIASRAPFLLPYTFNLVYFDNRGNHPTQHLARTKRFARIEGADILAIGCRYGGEVELWLNEQPRRVIALDYFPAGGTWQPIQNRYPDGTVEFLAADTRRLPFRDDSFDIISSEALLEHVNPVDLCIDEIYRVVKPGGLVYAIFGPLFYTRGGAHYEGDYEHLLMPRQQFKNFIIYRQRSIEQQECLFYLDNNMFSYWTMDQYLDAFKAFETLFSIVFLSPEAYQYRYAHQSEWEQLKTKWPEKDLLVSGLAIWLRKPAR